MWELQNKALGLDMQGANLKGSTAIPNLPTSVHFEHLPAAVQHPPKTKAPGAIPRGFDVRNCRSVSGANDLEGHCRNVEILSRLVGHSIGDEGIEIVSTLKILDSRVKEWPISPF